jgi:hypothetical protein
MKGVYMLRHEASVNFDSTLAFSKQVLVCFTKVFDVTAIECVVSCMERER